MRVRAAVLLSSERDLPENCRTTAWPQPQTIAELIRVTWWSRDGWHQRMAVVYFDVSMSLDGFIAGPNVGVENPG
jgi:hypothetical protein